MKRLLVVVVSVSLPAFSWGYGAYYQDPKRKKKTAAKKPAAEVGATGARTKTEAAPIATSVGSTGQSGGGDSGSGGGSSSRFGDALGSGFRPGVLQAEGGPGSVRGGAGLADAAAYSAPASDHGATGSANFVVPRGCPKGYHLDGTNACVVDSVESQGISAGGGGWACLPGYHPVPPNTCAPDKH